MTDSVRRIAEALFVERMKNDYFSAVTQTEWREIATACVQKAQELEDALGADKPEAKPKLEPLPCPRCGSETRKHTERHYTNYESGSFGFEDRFAISCREITCPLKNINLFYYATLDEAVKKWNKYVMDEHLKREHKKIHKMLEYVHVVSKDT